MSENKRLYMIIGIIIILVGIIGVSIVSSNIRNKEIYEEFVEEFNSDELEVIFLERPTCYYCQLTAPVMESLSEKYDFDYEDINTDNLNASTLTKILNKLGVNGDDFGTPYIAIVKEGKVVASQPGYAETADLFKFFQNNGVIDKKAEYKEILNYVDYNGYKKVISSSKPQLLAIVQTGCGACISAKPVLEEISTENNITINALNLTNLSDEDRQTLGSTLDYLNENDWGTPLLLVVKDNKVIDASNGFLDKSTYQAFLKKNNFIK